MSLTLTINGAPTLTLNIGGGGAPIDPSDFVATGSSEASFAGTAAKVASCQFSGVSTTDLKCANVRAVGFTGSASCIFLDGASGLVVMSGRGTMFVNNALAIGSWTSSATFAPTGWGRTRFAPFDVWPGITVVDANIVIPVADLVGINVDDVDPETGDWRAVFQSICESVNQYTDGLATSVAPLTIRSFMLEDWSRNNTTFGRHMKRLFLIEFTVENSPTTVFNSGE